MAAKEYPREELELRWGRAHERMERDGLDALIVTERGNFWFFSGVRSGTGFYNKMRPTVAILPKGRLPTLLVYSLEQQRTAAASWATDVRSYLDAPFPPELLVETLRDLGLAEGRIGLELGASQRMWFSLGHLEAVRAALPGAHFVDASATIEWQRLHKTPLEVERLREAAATSQRALDRLTADLRVGMSAREVAAQLTIHMIQEGADLRAPGGIGAEFSSLPDDHAFAAGEVIRFDFGAVRQGYWADICRRVAFGRNEQAERHQEILNRMMARMMGELGPGVPVTRFHALHDAELKRAGYPPLPPSKRIGHGLGLDPSEPPSLSGEDDTVLEPGMVVTLEPRFTAAYGLAHIEETFVITEAGRELISGGQSERLITV